MEDSVTAPTQSFENHERVVPLYHFVASAIFFANAITTGWRAFQQPTWDRILAFGVALALLIALYYMRVFALTVQDRVIRFEMRLRLSEILPQAQRARISELSLRQIVALRFAGDAELPGLVERVLSERIQEGKAIKRLIQDWQADHLRV